MTALFALGVWSVVREWERPWWRTDAVVRPAGTAFAGPEGEVMVVSRLPSGVDYTIIDAKGVVWSPGGVRFVTPWCVVPMKSRGVLVHPQGAKTEHDPRLKSDGRRWSFVPIRSPVPVEIVGSAPVSRTPDGPQTSFHARRR